jgi:MFS family permease
MSTVASLGRVLLPFGFGYFLSFLYRTVNAVIGPEVAASLGLGAAELGLLTSAYFVAFAAFQIPLGVLLDRYGPRHVEAALVLVAAAGAVVFARGESTLTLALGRALIGLGVSACLGSRHGLLKTARQDGVRRQLTFRLDFERGFCNRKS